MGINISPGQLASAGGLGIVSIITGSTSPLTSLIPTFGPLRPSQWSKPALTMITVPAAYTHKATNPGVSAQGAAAAAVSGVYTIGGTGTTVSAPSKDQVYVFDAVMRLGHSQRVTITQNPVQTGANIADHAFLNPAHLSMGIAMSDVMAAYAPGMWTGASTKSISAFKTLDSLRAARIPLTVTTRLKTYPNMLIEDIRTDDSVKTLYGLSAIIEFQQIVVASVATQAVSARNQTTDDTNLSTIQASNPTDGLSAQNELPSSYTDVPSATDIQAKYGTVQGAGTWSSNNTGDIASVYG